jgi:hypothetical protein
VTHAAAVGVVHAGGADGKILQWDVSDGTMAEGKFAAPSITLEHPYGKYAPKS